MKDSGIEWIGEIPEGWERRKLKDVSEYQEGPGLRTWQFTDSGIKVICVTNISDSGIDFSKYTKYISEEEYHSQYEHFTVKKGDILLSSSGASWGKVAFYNSDEIVILNTSTIRFKNKSLDAIIPGYVQWILRCDSTREQLRLLMTGSCQPNFGSTHLNKVLVPLPQIDEQQFIASYLDIKCTSTDNAIEKERLLIEKLKEYRQALITEAVTKGLNRDAKMKDSGVEWIGEIPDNWKCIKIKYHFEILKRLYYHEDRDVLSVTQNGIKIKDIKNNDGQIAQSYSGYQLVHVNDFVMNHMDLLTGGIDCSKFEGVTSPDYRVFRLRDDEENREYFKYVFLTYYRNKIFYGHGQGVSFLGRWRLQREVFNNMEIPLPPLPEQQSIAEYLDRKCAAIDKAIRQKEDIIGKLEEYKKSLIYECVTGKKEVRAQG